jgi:hypothetical protein
MSNLADPRETGAAVQALHRGHMDDHDHAHRHSSLTASSAPSLNQLAFSATVHCLTGCGIGEVLGMVVGTALGWGNGATIVLAVVLAFLFGYLLTLAPLVRSGMPAGQAVRIALAADTASIAVMELIDNVIMLVIPGAMDAPLGSLLFWGSLACALLVAGVAAFPVNRWLIARGGGHALAHAHHQERGR